MAGWLALPLCVAGSLGELVGWAVASWGARTGELIILSSRAQRGTELEVGRTHEAAVLTLAWWHIAASAWSSPRHSTHIRHCHRRTLLQGHLFMAVTILIEARVAIKSAKKHTLVKRTPKLHRIVTEYVKDFTQMAHSGAEAC